MAYAVSKCCGSTVLHGHKEFFPLSQSEGRILMMVDFCESCEKEVEDVDMACEICGEIDCDEDCEKEVSCIGEISEYACY